MDRASFSISPPVASPLATDAAAAAARNITTVHTAAEAIPVAPIGDRVSPFSWRMRTITGNAVTASVAPTNRLNPRFDASAGLKTSVAIIGPIRAAPARVGWRQRRPPPGRSP